MKAKDKYGLGFLFFYKLVSSSSSSKDLYTCCMEDCDHQDLFHAKNGEDVWHSFILDDSDIKTVLEGLDKFNQIYFIDTKKFYKDLDELKNDALVYYLSRIGEQNE